MKDEAESDRDVPQGCHLNEAMMVYPRSCPVLWMLAVVGLGWAAGCGSKPIPPRAILTGHGGRVTSVAFAPGGKALASRSDDGSVKVWDLPSGRQRMTVPEFPSSVGAVAFSPDGSRLAANEAAVGVIAYDAVTGAGRSRYPFPPRDPPEMGCYSVNYGWGVAYSPDGKTLASGGSNGGEGGFVTLWDVASARGEDLLGPCDSPVTSVAFSPAGDALASVETAGTVRIWDLPTRRERLALPGPGGGSRTLAYSPDGLTLISAGADQGVRIWDAATGRESMAFTGHRTPVACVAIARDGRLVASGDRGGTVLLWDLPTRRLIARLAGHEGAVLSVAFSPADDLLASGSADRTIRLWDLPPRR